MTKCSIDYGNLKMFLPNTNQLSPNIGNFVHVCRCYSSSSSNNYGNGSHFFNYYVPKYIFFKIVNTFKQWPCCMIRTGIRPFDSNDHNVATKVLQFSAYIVKSANASLETKSPFLSTNQTKTKMQQSSVI